MCSTGGLRNFPLLNTVTVTDDLKNRVTEQLDLDIQWGPRSIEPNFTSPSDRMNQGFLEYHDGGDRTTTLRLHGSSYSLVSLQLSTPAHKNFLALNKRSDCSGEIIMAFRAQNLTLASESFIFLCVPILAKITASPNVYLESLRLNTLPGRPLTLESILPTTDRHYLTYSTCMNYTQDTKTFPVQLRVLVFTGGIEIGPSQFNTIAERTNAARSPSLPPPYLPFGLASPSGAQQSTIGDSISFSRYLRYSEYKAGSSTATSSTRTDALSSYKCVPLLPDQNVKDGTIVVDTDTGELLSQVLDDKKASDASGVTSPASPISPAIINKILIIGLSIFIVTLILLIIGYYVMTFLSPDTDKVLGISVKTVSTWGPAAVAGLVLGVIGFVIGFMLKNMV